MIVYKHTNLINQKVYIGITKHSNPNKRWKDGYGYKKNKNFYKDILKYGWNNFTHEIIANNLSIETAQELEKFLIQKYQSNIPQYGYNLNSGGGYANFSSSKKKIKKKRLFINFNKIPQEDKNLYVSDFLKKYPQFK